MHVLPYYSKHKGILKRITVTIKTQIEHDEPQNDIIEISHSIQINDPIHCNDWFFTRPKWWM